MQQQSLNTMGDGGMVNAKDSVNETDMLGITIVSSAESHVSDEKDRE